jgi:ribulose-phosphate 3-epimerase
LSSAKKNRLIAPSILSADFANLEAEVKAVAAAGADLIHVDVMDGHFVNNLTIGIPVVAALKKISPLPLDVHLMIEKPEKYIAQFAQAGATYITIHVESTTKPLQVLQDIRRFGARPGVTLRPATPVEKIFPYLPIVDLALVMTVEPGFGGQEFLQEQANKVRVLSEQIKKSQAKCLIEVDGGINPATAAKVPDADILVAGSFIFRSEYQKAIHKLREVT